MKIEMIWIDPQIVVFHDLMFENECDKIVENLSAKLKTWKYLKDGNYAGKPWTNVRVMKK